mmetsp:Transcript_13192/g.21677  ORF Transcript_13192/g.21677 Transcript_13192/m.21677 type:complete len:822 (+) Transcript_13192:163-2628(+)
MTEESKISELELGEIPAAPPAAEELTPKFDSKSAKEGAHQSTSPTYSPPIVDEARECLAQSNLIFLYADLRLLSATGRINTKFETLCIDSDRVPRTTASQMAQLQGEISSRLNSSNHPDGLPYCEGVSPAQIMAILIVELRKEVMAYRKRAKTQLEKEDERGGILASVAGCAPNLNEDDTESDSEDENGDAGLMNTVTNAKGRKEFETGMHAMIRGYNETLYTDMKGMPEVEVSKAVFHKVKERIPLKGTGGGIASNLPSPFRVFSNDEGDMEGSLNSREKNEQSWLSSFRKSAGTNSASQDNVLSKGDLDGEGNAEGKGPPPLKAVVAAKMLLRKKNSKSREDISNVGISVTADNIREEEEKNEEGDNADVDSAGNANADRVESRVKVSVRDDQSDSPIRRGPNLRGSALTRQLTTRINQYREDHALYNKGMVGRINSDDYDTFNGAENVVNQFMRVRNSIIASGKTPIPLGDSLDSEVMTEKELLNYMTKCIESRKPDRLDFMADFFREHTVSSTMVKSKTRIVWLQDWFPIKDLVYGIAVDKEKKRVLVVFRGCQTKPDWGHAFDFILIHTRNPVKDDYEGRTNTIKLHQGFYRYLLRTRKDTKTTKYDEIANKVYEYGSKMIGDDFTVSVNGYSLGGALSLLFGFYASTDERFTMNGPVKIFTYGAPYIGGHTFADAFRYQECARKVLFARFHNNNDLFAHIPPNVKPTRRGTPYAHAGVDVKLFPVPGRVSCRGSRSPAVKYNRKLPPVKAYFDGLKKNILLNTTWPWKMNATHGLPELQQRLAMAVQLANDAEDNLLHKTLEELYDELVFKNNSE